MGKYSKKNKKAAPAAAASTDAAVKGHEPPVYSGAGGNGDGTLPPVEPNYGGELPADSAAAAIGDEVVPQPPSVEAAYRDESPLDSAAAANGHGDQPPRPFSVQSTAEANGYVIPAPAESAAAANGDMVEQPPLVGQENGGSKPTAETGLAEASSVERHDSSLEREGEVEKLKALNGMLVKEAVETRGQVAALATLVDERSADAGVLAIVDHQVLRDSLVAHLSASTEVSVALWARLADDQELLQAAEARVAREAYARREATARFEEAGLEERRVLDVVIGKETEAAAATKTVNGLEAVVSELAGKSTELCAERGELEKQLGEMNASAHSVLAQKAEVEGSFMDSKNTQMYKQDVEGKLAQKSKQLVALSSSKAEMELKVQSLEAELSAALARNRELESDVETSKTDLAAAKTELKKLQFRLADVGKKYSTVLAEADSIRNEIHKKMTKKEATLSVLATEKGKLEKELNGMKRKIESIRANKDDVMATSHQKDVELSKLRAKLNGLRDSVADQRALCEDLRASNSSLENVVDTFQKELGKEKTEGDRLRLMLGEVEGYAAEKEREITGLKTEVQNKREHIFNLNGEMKKLQLAFDEAKQREKSGVWTWLCPTTTVIAAASFAYAARSQ